LYKKTPAERELVEINEAIGEMVLLLRGEANEYATSIRTHLAADCPKITANRVQLQQVLMNLMLNGIEAMKETGRVLTVRFELRWLYLAQGLLTCGMSGVLSTAAFCLQPSP
jgi:C4-dicarboxylate-specific signal transduction histidine kinase